MKDDRLGGEKGGRESQDRKTRVRGDRVIHTVKGHLYSGNRYEGPWGLTNEQWQAQRVGEKLSDRQVREAAHDGLTGKQQVEKLTGTDEVAGTKMRRRE